MKFMMKPVEATVERNAVEATAVEATTVKAATTVEASASVEASAATSRCNRRLNQADRCQRQHSQYQFPRHASLRSVPSPSKHGTPSRREYSTTKKLRSKLTVSRRRPVPTVQLECKPGVT
jgi:hypothetical protein